MKAPSPRSSGQSSLRSGEVPMPCSSTGGDTNRRMIGTSLPRLEDDRLLRGAARFVDDLKPEGCLHVAFLRSPVASARIGSIDVSAAAAMPGVVAVFTAADLEGTCAPMNARMTTPGLIAPDRPILAS